MTYTAQDIVAKLPGLRRYAGALAGNQGAGDQYVRTFLEVIIRDKPISGATGDLQRDLFRLFHRIYDSADPGRARHRRDRRRSGRRRPDVTPSG